MDRELDTLSRLDWTEVESAGRIAARVAQTIRQPGPLRELLEHCTKDERLLGLSERQWWGDRIVLFDDPASMLRIRLHRFDAGTHFPHSHRWPFHTTILAGRYVHRLYGPEQFVRDAARAGTGFLQPSVVREEGAGANYVLDQHIVHSVTPCANTFSLVIQGPRLKDTSLRTGPDGSIIWKGGRSTETADSIEMARMTEEHLDSIRVVALERSLLDR